MQRPCNIIGGSCSGFAVLKFTGWYAGIESALDLQYNSPLILVPLYGFAVLAVLCFFVGF